MSTSRDAQYSHGFVDALPEVSYSVFSIKDQEQCQILQALATEINVRLKIDEQDSIPFIAPTNFQLASSQDKLFLYGPGGSGKSRLIFELVRANFDQEVDRLVIINSSQISDRNIQRTNLLQIASTLTRRDIVVWDNFPDGLSKKDFDSGKHVLEVISSSEAKHLFISLKPKFLETYRGITDGVPDVYAYQVKYDVDQIKEIIKTYGTAITQFKTIYSSYVAQDVASISKVLWQKEPFPLTIFNYYRELAAKRNAGERPLNAIVEAEAMLYPTDYYEYQFEQIRSSEARVHDAEFLYTMKMCYDLGLDRKPDLVEHLQSKTFGSAAPKDVFRSMSSWIYLSGKYISMHDVPRGAIKFDNQTRLKITEYLIDNFSEIVSNSEDSLNSIGMFLGRNIEILIQHGNNPKDFLPYSIYQFIKSNRRLEVAFGLGVGEVFYSLAQDLQQEILERIEKDGEFARGLGESLGKSIEELDGSVRIDILSKRIATSILFARGLGESLGENFLKLSEAMQEEIFLISLKEKNYNFQRGFGTGLGRKFRSLAPDVQQRLRDLSSKHIALAIGMGYGLALELTMPSSSSAPKEFQTFIGGFMNENAEITRGLGMGLGQNYALLKGTLQEEILRWTENNPRLEFGFAYQLSFLYTSLKEEYQDLIFKRTERNSDFAYGSGWGFGVAHAYLPKEMQQRLLDLAKKNMRFAIGLGAGIGNQLQYLTKDKEEELFSLTQGNEGFATGAAFGIGRSFTFLRQELQDKAWRLMQTNYSFALGLGWGLGFAYSYLHDDLQNRVLEYTQKEPGFARGFGWGLGFMFTYLSESIQQKANLLALHNGQFAFGLGLGMGSLFNYLSQDLRQEIWKRAESSAQFASGLGSELGYLFRYLPARLQQDILARSQSNAHLARGLGWGLGVIFTSLPKNRQQHLLQEAQQNHELLRGLGWGLGHVWAYLPGELQKTHVRMASTSIQFATGLGEGVGRSFPHLDRQLAQWAVKLSHENEAIARGLGCGLGHILKYMDSESAHEVWRRAEYDVQFAIGLGEGLGEVIGFLPESFQNEVFAKMRQSIPLSRGLGSGLGSNVTFYLSDKNLSASLFAFLKENKDFRRGYGEGLGRIFSYWTEPVLNDVIMPNMSLDTQFAIGLGEGTGQSLPYEAWLNVMGGNRQNYSSINRQASTLEKLLAFDGFLYGLGLQFSKIINFVPKQTRDLILQVLPKYQHFAFGVGNGLGRAFPSLDQKLQEDALGLGETSSEFALGLGQGVGLSFRYLEAIVQQGLLLFADKNIGFAKGLGQAIGNTFPLLNQQLQEEMLNFAKKSEGFAKEASIGLSHSLVYLDETLQRKLASWGKIKDPDKSSLQDPAKKDVSTLFSHHDNDFLVLLNRHQNRTAVDDDGQPQGSHLSKENPAEILFSGRRENYCICYIDMMNSTKISSTLNDLQLSRYYSTFLNSMATIAKNFGATIIKNAGDCLIFYFPSTSNSSDQGAFRDVIECGITMISAHQAINSKLFEQSLPPLNYRISADYGKVEVARSSSSQTDDLFGSTMNVCAKINSKAPANGIGIGHNLYQIVSPISDNEYSFERIGEYSGFREAYPIYSIKPKHERKILNPFRRRPETLLDMSFVNDKEDSLNH